MIIDEGISRRCARGKVRIKDNTKVIVWKTRRIVSIC